MGKVGRGLQFTHSNQKQIKFLWLEFTGLKRIEQSKKRERIFFFIFSIRDLLVERLNLLKKRG